MNYSSIQILIVDDTSMMRVLIKSFLRNMGVTKLLEASDGEMALEILRHNPVDLILSDWNMPKITGIELLREVRGDFHLKRIPFIMISAESSAENISQAIQLKVNHYLIKPFTAAQIEQKVGLTCDSILDAAVAQAAA